MYYFLHIHFKFSLILKDCFRKIKGEKIIKNIIVVLTLVGFVLAGCSSNLTDSTNANTESTTNKEISQVESSVENANKEINITNALSVQEVLNIAEKESITNIENLKLENEFGKDYWIIEGFNPEIELVLDAITGEIVARDND